MKKKYNEKIDQQNIKNAWLSVRKQNEVMKSALNTHIVIQCSEK